MDDKPERSPKAVKFGKWIMWLYMLLLFVLMSLVAIFEPFPFTWVGMNRPAILVLYLAVIGFNLYALWRTQPW